MGCVSSVIVELYSNCHAGSTPRGHLGESADFQPEYSGFVGMNISMYSLKLDC